MSALTALLSGRVAMLAAFVCACTLIAGCGPPANTPPTADAGPDQTVDAGASVTLDGSASSDPDRDVLSFSWTQTLGTPVTLSSTTDPVVTFTAPAQGTQLEFQLTVSDGQTQSVATTHVGVRPAGSSGRITEMMQRSVTDDPAVIGNFPSTWQVTSIGGPPPPASESEIAEFAPMLAKVQWATLLDENVASGDSRSVSLQLARASGLSGSARWIGTTDPLTVTISLDGTTLATGNPYHFGNDRGGAFLKAQAAAAGQATLSVTNTSAATIKLRLVLAGSNQ